MHRFTTLTAMLLTLPFVVAGATAQTDACHPAEPAIEAGGYYLKGYNALLEVWEESNGAPGLQRRATSCIGGPTLPPDTCVAWTTDPGFTAGCLMVWAGHHA